MLGGTWHQSLAERQPNLTLRMVSYLLRKFPYFSSRLFFLILFCFITFSFYKSKEEIYSNQIESCLTDDETFVSTCSCKADNRGLHQNVIAFSLYGDFSDPNIFNRYVDPIKATLANISQVYPGNSALKLRVISFIN